MCTRCKESVRAVVFEKYFPPGTAYAKAKNAFDYATHREEILISRRAYYQANRERVIARVHEYRRRQRNGHAEQG